AAFDRRFRHVEAGVARRPQSHDLADGDGNVGISAAGLIAPAAFVILIVNDELYGPLERIAELLAQFAVVDHAVDLGEEERAKAVAVHRAVRHASPADEV